MTMVNTGVSGVTTGAQAPTIFVMPAGTTLVPGPLHFGLPGDSNAPSAIPQAFIHGFQPCAHDSEACGCKAVSGKDIPYRPAYVRQVGENWANVGRIDSRSIKFLGPYQSMHATELGRGPKTTPQFNLLQPLPYWNVWAISPQQLAAYQSLTGEFVTQVPASYSAAGPPNIYLGA
jgi:hypothetical protein